MSYPLAGSPGLAALSRSAARNARIRSEIVKIDPIRITTLVGRLDEPTDGVKDYCFQLADALRQKDLTVDFAEVRWLENGWRKALQILGASLPARPGDWVLLQYTGMAWSRRGFPSGALAVARALRSRGARVAVVFHEQKGFRAKGIWAWLRFRCQEWTIHRLYRTCDLGIFTVPLSGLPWVARNESKARFIPIGANIPGILTPGRTEKFSSEARRTVAVFCVTTVKKTSSQVEEISTAVLSAMKKLPNLRLIVFGRGALEARILLERSLQDSGIELSILGILLAEQIAGILSQSDVLLYVREELTPQHGSALAAIACGLPLVAYGDPAKCFPMSEAGVLLAPPGNREALGAALTQILSENELWNRMRARSIEAHRNYFAWDVIAQTFAAALSAATQTNEANATERVASSEQTSARLSPAVGERAARRIPLR